jgi:eukaryotic-like serine/threonine-protein kinase
VRPGDLIAGKYRIERVIAEGGMGVIARALHLDLDRAVAIKLVRDELSEREDILARLMLEARAVARMRSEHVARVLDVGRLESGYPYIVMEYLEGKDLWTILHEKGRMPQPLAVDYAVQACEALAEAHALGIVHRDIKPENLFLTECPDGAPIVKLLDFGISKQSNLRVDGNITGASTAVGSPHYMAPEQMRAESNIDARADIWAIGVILYELVSGVSPFDAESMPGVCARVVEEQPTRLTEMDPEIPELLDATIFRCLEKDRKKRPADVAELAAALAPFGTSDTPQRAERIARIVSSSGARTSEQREAGSNTATIGGNTGSDAPTSLMPVAGSLLELCSKQPSATRRTGRPIALVSAVALCAGIAAGVFFVARPPLSAVAEVKPAAAEAKAAAPLETGPPAPNPAPLLDSVALESVEAAPLVSPAPAPRRPDVTSARRYRAGLGGAFSADSTRAKPDNTSLSRVVTKAAALNRSKASATMISEGTGSDLAKHDSTAAGPNVAKFANEESMARPNAWDSKNFGGRR